MTAVATESRQSAASKQSSAEASEFDRLLSKGRQISEIASASTFDSLINVDQFEKSLRIARGCARLWELIDDEVMNEVMRLQGSEIGFLTDKDKEGGYSADTVKKCCIDAIIKGVRWVGNEMNIIAGKCYITRNGMRRKVAEFPGLANLHKEIGVPVLRGEGAIVKVSATWTLGSKQDGLSAEIPVKVNKNMGADAIIGKADRKLLARIYDKLTGSEHNMADGEIDDLPDRCGQPGGNGNADVLSKLAADDQAPAPDQPTDDRPPASTATEQADAAPTATGEPHAADQLIDWYCGHHNVDQGTAESVIRERLSGLDPWKVPAKALEKVERELRKEVK